jgi:hypothetical protein
VSRKRRLKRFREFRSAGPERILRFIASGVLGPAAFTRAVADTAADSGAAHLRLAHLSTWLPGGHRTHGSPGMPARACSLAKPSGILNDC